MAKNRDPLEVVGCSRGYSHEELINNLHRHASYSPVIEQQIRAIPEAVLRNSGTQMAKKINRMMREVSTEVYRAKQFTRTEINDRGVLFGVVSLKHQVVDLVLNYFHERWPKCVICLYNERKHKTGTINEKGKIIEFNLSLRDIVNKMSESRPVIPYFEDIQFSGEEIFETLYKSQFISERENTPYYKKMIPDHCFKLPGMKSGVEKHFRNKKLNEFL